MLKPQSIAAFVASHGAKKSHTLGHCAPVVQGATCDNNTMLASAAINRVFYNVDVLLFEW